MKRATPPIIGYLLLAPPEADDEEGTDWPTLLDALGRHSPTVEAHPPHGCWLDLRAGGRRAPAPDERGASILTTARDLGHECCRLGVAPTPGVARLAAICGAANPTVLAPAAVAAFVAPLPVAALGLPEECEHRLALVGLCTLGQIAALPAGSLGDYLGAAALPVEAVARGEDGRPLLPARPPLVVEARRALDYALADRAQLEALIGQLLARLLPDLARRGLGATRARLTLALERGKPLTVEVPLPAPTTDPRAILGHLRAALPRFADSAGAGDEADDGPGGVTAVTLALVAPQPLVARQLSIFDVPTGRRALLALGVGAARRRGGGHLGRWESVDPAHPLPERRYAFVEGGLGDEAAGSA